MQFTREWFDKTVQLAGIITKNVHIPGVFCVTLAHSGCTGVEASGFEVELRSSKQRRLLLLGWGWVSFFVLLAPYQEVPAPEDKVKQSR